MLHKNAVLNAVFLATLFHACLGIADSRPVNPDSLPQVREVLDLPLQEPK